MLTLSTQARQSTTKALQQAAGLGQLIVSGYFLQYSSTATPEAQAMQDAVNALQQAIVSIVHYSG